jgi:hypothetical protein
MIRQIVTMLPLLLAFSAADALRVIEQPERPYELSLAQVTLPSTTTGGLTVKPCEDCAYSTHVLTATTEFYVNNQIVPFVEFTRVAEELRALRSTSEATFVGVYVDIESGRVTRVKLRTRSV